MPSSGAQDEQAETPPPHTFQEVYDAWHAAKPTPKLIHFSEAAAGSGFDGTFNCSYEVTLDGWRYIVQAHAHVTWGRPHHASGHTYIPGFKDQQVRTPDWVAHRAPDYDADKHKHDWDSDPTYRAKLYSGAYRRPTKL